MSYLEGAPRISGLDSSDHHPPPTPFLLFLGQLASTALKKKKKNRVFPECVYAHTWCLQGPENDPRSLGTGITEGYEHSVSADNRIQVLCKCS